MVVIWGGSTNWKFIHKNTDYFSQKRDYLLFSSVGDRDSAKKAVSMWLEDSNRNYDTVFYYYKKLPENCPADYCEYKKGFKFENFLDYALKNDISKYKAVWIVDDDIQIRTKDINKMFKIFTEYGLDLGMPAFSTDSEPKSPLRERVLFQKSDNILHYTDFIEVNTPIFSQKAIDICLPTFPNSKTAYSVDYIWSYLLKGKNMGVIDITPFYHEDDESALDETAFTGLVREDHSEYGKILEKKWGIVDWLKNWEPKILGYVKNNKYFAKKKDYLLFSSVGDRESAKKAISMWLEDSDRNYDTVFYYYKKLPENCPADYCEYKKGFKFENFADYASKNDISRYKAIWIVDDDIQIRTKDINKMFEIFNEYKLDLGMPSLSKGSYTWWKDVLIQKPGNILHYTNFIENGIAIFSKKGLKICLPTFYNAKTGWGLDFIWSKLLNNKNIAVIDYISCLHPPSESDLDEVISRENHQVFGYELMKKWDVEKFKPKIFEYAKE